MKKVMKGLLFGVMIACTCIVLYGKIQLLCNDIYKTISIWKSLPAEERQEIWEFAKCITYAQGNGFGDCMQQYTPPYAVGGDTNENYVHEIKPYHKKEGDK